MTIQERIEQVKSVYRLSPYPDGFRSVDRRELAERFPEFSEETGRLAFPAEETK